MVIYECSKRKNKKLYDISYQTHLQGYKSLCIALLEVGFRISKFGLCVFKQSIVNFDLLTPLRSYMCTPMYGIPRQ